MGVFLDVFIVTRLHNSEIWLTFAFCSCVHLLQREVSLMGGVKGTLICEYKDMFIDCYTLC